MRPAIAASSDLGRRDSEIGAVMLADADEIYPQPVGQHGFFDDVAHHLSVRKQFAVGAGRDVAESVQTEFEEAAP